MKAPAELETIGNRVQIFHCLHLTSDSPTIPIVFHELKLTLWNVVIVYQPDWKWSFIWAKVQVASAVKLALLLPKKVSRKDEASQSYQPSLLWLNGLWIAEWGHTRRKIVPRTFDIDKRLQRLFFHKLQRSDFSLKNREISGLQVVGRSWE